MKILIIGNGFLGKRCASAWPDAIVSTDHIRTIDDVRRMLNTHTPDCVLNAAGVVGKPNVDWCESHQLQTIVGNAQLPLMIAEACLEQGAYLLHIGSGCIFYGQSPDPAGWREADFGNPLPVYSRSKWAADLALSTLPNVGIARIRMPIDSVPGPANLINKLVGSSKVVDVGTSVTMVPDMIGVIRQSLEKKAVGIFHVTNPGILKHRELIALYEEIVDPTHKNDWIREEDLVGQGLAVRKRSNNILQSKNLEKLGIHMREVHEALREVMFSYKQNKQSKQ